MDFQVSDDTRKLIESVRELGRSEFRGGGANGYRDLAV